MKVVLRADVAEVGKKGDIVDVADGYARNFLIPKGRAFKASDGVVAQAEAMRRSRDLKDAKDREAAEVIARKLVPLVIMVTAKAGTEGRLFGSVTAQDIVEAVSVQASTELDRRRLHLDDPIKSVGTHEVPVSLHPEVQFRITVEVVPQ
ncbi:MAG TPA: 50S ribosomal protein L9 [Acidimicrobiales bacterium]|nr:50S ribosomal protein L9 [Acidimicrobiales bacterium]